MGNSPRPTRPGATCMLDVRTAGATRSDGTNKPTEMIEACNVPQRIDMDTSARHERPALVTPPVPGPAGVPYDGPAKWRIARTRGNPRRKVARHGRPARELGPSQVPRWVGIPEQRHPAPSAAGERSPEQLVTAARGRVGDTTGRFFGRREDDVFAGEDAITGRRRLRRRDLPRRRQVRLHPVL